MPINIYDESSRETIAWLCDDDWRLTEQTEALESWLKENHDTLPEGEYVADIGFCWNKNAGGGGAALSTGFMKLMVRYGVHLHLSEYPGFDDEQKDAEQAPRRNAAHHRAPES